MADEGEWGRAERKEGGMLTEDQNNTERQVISVCIMLERGKVDGGP